MSLDDEYTIGETVYVWKTVRERGGQKADPSVSIKVTIDDPDGAVKVNDAAMTKDAVGEYYYPYTLTAGDVVGLWNTEAIIKNGSPEKVVIEPDTFTAIVRTT